MKAMSFAVAFLVLSGFAPQQVEQKDIDAAIKKGADFLLATNAKGITESSNVYEMVIYALIHADVDPSKTPIVKDGIEKLITLEPSAFGDYATYRIAVQALALHSLLLKIHRHPAYAYLDKRIDAIQERIALCGQYLVDTQSGHGQWTYKGKSTNKPEKEGIISTGSSASAKESKKKKLPKEVDNTGKKLAWESAVDLTGTIYILKPKFAADKNDGTAVGQKRPRDAAGGDNSNTQYGILGLIAAQMSGCIVPEGTWQRALEWFEASQNDDGGFAYQGKEERPYGSMTTAGIVALASCYRYLAAENKKEKKDKKEKKEKNPENDLAKQPKLAAAVKWLADNFTVSDNPKREGVIVFYYLYGLERCGAFLKTDKFGDHRWYDEGAAWLVKGQLADGSWGASWVAGGGAPKGWDVASINACFAILFLKRATSEIIETGTSGGQPPIIEQK